MSPEVLQLSAGGRFQLTYEGLALRPRAQRRKFVLDGDNTYGGRVVTNPSGGLLAKRHPPGATGLAQCAEPVGGDEVAGLFAYMDEDGYVFIVDRLKDRAEEILGHVKGLIAGFKAPRSVELVDALPVSAAGKVLKRTPRQKYVLSIEP